MNDQDIVSAIEKLWDDYAAVEIVVTKQELLDLIEILHGLYIEAMIKGGGELILIQFLCQRGVNSAFIRGVKTTRIHTLLKGSVAPPAQGYHKPTYEEMTGERLDFENRLGDILDAIVEGSAS